jgi:hypothetical protein
VAAARATWGSARAARRRGSAARGAYRQAVAAAAAAATSATAPHSASGTLTEFCSPATCAGAQVSSAPAQRLQQRSAWLRQVAQRWGRQRQSWLKVCDWGQCEVQMVNWRLPSARQGSSCSACGAHTLAAKPPRKLGQSEAGLQHFSGLRIQWELTGTEDCQKRWQLVLNHRP